MVFFCTLSSTFPFSNTPRPKTVLAHQRIISPLSITFPAYSKPPYYPHPNSTIPSPTPTTNLFLHHLRIQKVQPLQRHIMNNPHPANPIRHDAKAALAAWVYTYRRFYRGDGGRGVVEISWLTSWKRGGDLGVSWRYSGFQGRGCRRSRVEQKIVQRWRSG